MSVGGEQSHLAFCITPVSAMGVGLDELPDGETICGFLGGDGDVFAHLPTFLFDSFVTAGSVIRE
jgi:hypothetical protein